MPVYKVKREVLQRIHHLLQRRTELEDQLSRGPRRVQVCQNIEREAVAKFETLRQEQQRLKLAAHDKQLQLKQRETKIEDLKNKRNACKSNREYTLLNDQIAADIQANSVLQDEILEVMEQIDGHTAAIAEAATAVDAAKQETAKIEAKIGSRKTSLDADLERVLADLKTAESKLSGDLVQEYRRRVAAMKEDALAAVDGDSCGNCSQVLTLQVQQEISMSRSHTCSSCNAILYSSQESIASV